MNGSWILVFRLKLLAAADFCRYADREAMRGIVLRSGVWLSPRSGLTDNRIT